MWRTKNSMIPMTPCGCPPRATSLWTRTRPARVSTRGRPVCRRPGRGDAPSGRKKARSLAWRGRVTVSPERDPGYTRLTSPRAKVRAGVHSGQSLLAERLGRGQGIPSDPGSRRDHEDIRPPEAVTLATAGCLAVRGDSDSTRSRLYEHSRPAAHQRSRDDAGISLVEVLVALACSQSSASSWHRPARVLGGGLVAVIGFGLVGLVRLGQEGCLPCRRPRRLKY